MFSRRVKPAKILSHPPRNIMEVRIDDEPIAKGHGLSKKKAEQDAAREACLKLELEEQ